MRLTLGEYLAGLAADPDRITLFKTSLNDAKDDMVSAGLDENMRKLLLQRPIDIEKIKEALNAGNAVAAGHGATSLLHSINLTMPTN